MNHVAVYLKDIHAGRKTGLLVVRKKEWERSLAFQDGGLIFARTTVPEERLGAILVNMGRLTPAAAAGIAEISASGRMVGEALVGRGLITQKDLYEALMNQMTRIGLALFTVFDAAIAFEERPRLVDFDFETKMFVPQLIELGVREMDFHPSLIEFFGPRVPVAGGRAPARTLGSEEMDLLGQFDGAKTAEELSILSSLEPRDFWKTLYMLFCLGLVSLKEPAGPILMDAAAPDAEILSRAPEEPAPPEAPEPMPPEIKEALDEINGLFPRLTEMDYFQLLGVARTASDEEIKKAYFKLARTYHPDRFGRHADAQARDKIDSVFDAVNKAYRTLTNRDQRALYGSKMAGPARSEDKDRGKNAEIRFRQGKTLFGQGRYEESAALLEEAVRLKDDKGDYYLLLAMAQSKVPSLSKKAERNFLMAIEIEPWNPEGYVGLGYLYKQVGLALRARRQFEKALEIDPDHKAARQGLDLGEEKKAAKGGLFSRDLFGGRKK